MKDMKSPLWIIDHLLFIPDPQRTNISHEINCGIQSVKCNEALVRYLFKTYADDQEYFFISLKFASYKFSIPVVPYIPMFEQTIKLIYPSLFDLKRRQQKITWVTMINILPQVSCGWGNAITWLTKTTIVYGLTARTSAYGSRAN